MNKIFRSFVLISLSMVFLASVSLAKEPKHKNKPPAGPGETLVEDSVEVQGYSKRAKKHREPSNSPTKKKEKKADATEDHVAPLPNEEELDLEAVPMPY